jgi:formylglycine-generating enzyme required for sulfatase activity
VGSSVTGGDMGRDSSKNKGARKPAESMYIHDIIEFCNARSKREGYDTAYYWVGATNQPRRYGFWRVFCKYTQNASGKKIGYRLPSEAEWEFACRGGTTGMYFWSSAAGAKNEYTWNPSNSGNTSHEVATKKPNPYGLYDMCGNVFEITNDSGQVYTSASYTDPIAPVVTLNPDLHQWSRGGAYKYVYSNGGADEVNSYFRAHMWYDCDKGVHGFRCVMRAQ